MRALVLEKQGELAIRDVPEFESAEAILGAQDVRVKLHTVGICGSDLHYYKHGRIGPFVVNSPMVLGHEASGTIVETGSDVKNLKVGDRVCMEPGIPDPGSRTTRMGIYNVDPALRFWATPPVHGVLRETCVHPAAFTFKLPDNISFAEAAMVEPLAVAIHAVTRARVKPGDIAVVLGAGPIGLLTALSALAAGCALAFVTDLIDAKLEIAGRLHPAIRTVNALGEDIVKRVMAETDGWGADVVFEASGSAKAAAQVFDVLAPRGCVTFIGATQEAILYDAGAAMVREARVENIFRYAHVFPRCLAMLSSGAIDVRPMITRTFDFKESIGAFEYAAQTPSNQIKLQIRLPD